MKKTVKIIIAAVAISIFNFQNSIVNSLHAQNDTVNPVYNESVVVVGDYNPVLDGVTEKVNIAPAVNDNISEDLQPKFTYSITPRRISSLTSTSGIKAAKVLGSPTRLYNNYMRFGLGHDFAAFNDFNPLIDLYYTSTRKDNYAFGGRFYHNTDITTFGRADNTPSSSHYGRDRETITNIDLFGKYILNKKHLFSANFAFNRQYGRYYGFSDSTLFNKLALSRDDISFSDYAFSYNNLALNLGAKSLNTDINKLGYDANIGMADMWGRYDFSQLSIDLDANVHYGFPMFSKYKAIAYLRTTWQGFRQRADKPATISDLPLGYDATQPLPDTVRDGRHLFTINPFVDFLFGGFKFHAGLEFGFNRYDDPDQTGHNLFPDLSIAKSFANNRISLAAGFQGGYDANDWNTIRYQNPFVAPAPQSFSTIDNNLFAYLRVNFSKKLILNININNHFLKNKMFFRLDPIYTLRNVFTPYYVDLNTLELAADFTFVNDEMISIKLGGKYSVDYNVPNNVILLHDPDFTANLDINLNYKDKWLFNMQTLFISSMDVECEINSTTLLNQVTQTTPAHFGVALGAEYIHSRALSFFAKIDNLTCQRYFLWANYPAPRFNLMLGLTYTFPNK